MPLENHIINLPGFKLVQTHGYDPLVFEVSYEGTISCPQCSGLCLRKKDRFSRLIRHESFGDRRTFLLIQCFKFLCLACKAYFNQRLPGILRYKRATEAFRKEVFNKHSQGITQRTLSQNLKIGSATVERWFHDYIKIYNQELKSASSPRVLGIDEHFFTKKQGYATTFCDLGRRKVYDVALGRSEASLKAYLAKLPDKSNTKVILMDLSETYRSIAKKYFPQALIVADRFHVIRLINYHFQKTWQQLDPEGKYNRGLLSLMRRHQWNLSQEQLTKLKIYLQKYPGLEPIYDFKQDLCALLLLKKQNQYQCRKLIPQLLWMIEELKNSPFINLKKLGLTLHDWQQEIARMWRFTKTNSITEGLHNKMEMISRRAYGFRNFNNYRLRIKILCS